MKATYFHGLESKQGGSKVEFLESVFDEVYAPALDYRARGDELFEEVLLGCRGSALLIGSSMGGWFAYLAATRTGIPTLLFNPAVHSRSIEFGIGAGDEDADHDVVLGEADNVIDPGLTREWFQSKGTRSVAFSSFDGGHRIPLEVFKAAVLAKVEGIGRSA